MSVRRVGCPGRTVLTEAERGRLNALPDCVDDVVDGLNWCELEPGHEGKHYAYGQRTREHDWWMVWDEAAARDLVVLAGCAAEDPPGGWDPDPCTLFDGHPGDHGFTANTDKWPIAMLMNGHDTDDVVDLTDLAPHQRHNHQTLARYGLSVRSYLLLADMMLLEKQYGQYSTRHFLAEDTPEPAPQLKRVDVFLPGLAKLISGDYVKIVRDPVYEPAYFESVFNTVVVSLTNGGRRVFDRIEANLIG